jgi:hypothetical protein
MPNQEEAQFCAFSYLKFPRDPPSDLQLPIYGDMRNHTLAVMWMYRRKIGSCDPVAKPRAIDAMLVMVSLRFIHSHNAAQAK